MKRFYDVEDSEYKKYRKFVEWSNEDGVFIGRCPDLFMGGVHGDDEVKVFKELCQVVREWVEIKQKDRRKRK